MNEPHTTNERNNPDFGTEHFVTIKVFGQEYNVYLAKVESDTVFSDIGVPDEAGNIMRERIREKHRFILNEV